MKKKKDKIKKKKKNNKKNKNKKKWKKMMMKRMRSPVTMRRSAPAHSMLSPTSSDPLIRGEQMSVPPLNDPPTRYGCLR